METKEKIKNLIHLAIKARKVSFGEDNYFSLLKKGRVNLVLLDKSLSEKSQKKIIGQANRNNVKYLFYPGDMDNEIKQGVKLLSFIDKNFARPISEMIRGKK